MPSSALDGLRVSVVKNKKKKTKPQKPVALPHGLELEAADGDGGQGGGEEEDHEKDGHLGVHTNVAKNPPKLFKKTLGRSTNLIVLQSAKFLSKVSFKAPSCCWMLAHYLVWLPWRCLTKFGLFWPNQEVVTNFCLLSEFEAVFQSASPCWHISSGF